MSVRGLLVTLPRERSPEQEERQPGNLKKLGSRQPCRAIPDHTELAGPFSLTSRKMLIGRGWLTAPGSGLNEGQNKS